MYPEFLAISRKLVLANIHSVYDRRVTELDKDMVGRGVLGTFFRINRSFYVLTVAISTDA